MVLALIRLVGAILWTIGSAVHIMKSNELQNELQQLPHQNVTSDTLKDLETKYSDGNTMLLIAASCFAFSAMYTAYFQYCIRRIR